VNATKFLDSYPLYVPHSSGTDEMRAAICQEAIRRTLPELAALATELNGQLGMAETKACLVSDECAAAAEALRVHLDEQGSDKAGWHLYHYAYGRMLRDRAAIRAVCEIGLGTNNTDIVSNMGPQGRPGASLRAFRDFLPNAMIYGGDVDHRVLFQENRIVTTWVDQTVEESVKAFFGWLPDDMDLIIDDGLHSPYANLLTTRYALPKVKEGGWFVVEDVQSNSLPAWQAVASFLPRPFRPYLFQGRGGMLFAVNREFKRDHDVEI
jgi:hypothetical protein